MTLKGEPDDSTPLRRRCLSSKGRRKHYRYHDITPAETGSLIIYFENAESRITVSVLPEDIVPWYRTGFAYSRRASEPLCGLVQEPQGRSEDKSQCVPLEAIGVGGRTPRHSRAAGAAEIRD